MNRLALLSLTLIACAPPAWMTSFVGRNSRYWPSPQRSYNVIAPGMEASALASRMGDPTDTHSVRDVSGTTTHMVFWTHFRQFETDNGTLQVLWNGEGWDPVRGVECQGRVLTDRACGRKIDVMLMNGAVVRVE